MATYEYAYVTVRYQPADIPYSEDEDPACPAEWTYDLEGFDPESAAAIRTVVGEATSRAEALLVP